MLAPFMDIKLAETSGLTPGFTDCIEGLHSHQHFQSFSVRSYGLLFPIGHTSFLRNKVARFHCLPFR